MAQLCVGRLARKPLGVHAEEFVLVVAGGCNNPHGSTRFPTSGLTQNIVLVFDHLSLFTGYSNSISSATPRL